MVGNNCNCAGFTLIELLVSLAIVSIFIVSAVAVFERSSRLYTTQNQTAVLQQELRAALDVVVTGARSAVYDPKQESTFVIKKAESTQFRFLSDLNGDGKLGDDDNNPYNSDDECEDRTFRFSLSTYAVQMVCGTGSSPGGSETLIGGSDSNVKITAFDFSFRDKNDTVTSIISEIRGVIVTITGQIPAGRDGNVTRTYKTAVDLRNAGPNA